MENRILMQNFLILIFFNIQIDSVLTRLQTIEVAKLKRREAMSKILDVINDDVSLFLMVLELNTIINQISIFQSAGGNDPEKKRQLENMIREELENWDDKLIKSRPTSSHSGLNSRIDSATWKQNYKANTTLRAIII